MIDATILAACSRHALDNVRQAKSALTEAIQSSPRSDNVRLDRQEAGELLIRLIQAEADLDAAVDEVGSVTNRVRNAGVVIVTE